MKTAPREIGAVLFEVRGGFVLSIAGVHDRVNLANQAKA
jgi:hypothetical protein